MIWIQIMTESCGDLITKDLIWKQVIWFVFDLQSEQITSFSKLSEIIVKRI